MVFCMSPMTLDAYWYELSAFSYFLHNTFDCRFNSCYCINILLLFGLQSLRYWSFSKCFLFNKLFSLIIWFLFELNDNKSCSRFSRSESFFVNCFHVSIKLFFSFTEITTLKALWSWLFLFLFLVFNINFNGNFLHGFWMSLRMMMKFFWCMRKRCLLVQSMVGSHISF